MPARLSSPVITAPLSEGFGRMRRPVLLLAIIAVMICAVAVRLSDPIQAIGFLTIGVAVGSVSVILLGVHLFRQARVRELHDVFQGLYQESDFPAVLEDHNGDLIAQNGHRDIHDFGQNGSVEAILGASFQHARALEHRLRQAVLSDAKVQEVVEDRSGQRQSVELLKFGSEHMVWTISPCFEEVEAPKACKEAASEVADTDLAGASTDQFLDALPVALARVSADGELLYVNGSAQNLLGEEAQIGANLNALLEGLGRSMDERIKDMMQGRSHMRTEVARCGLNGGEVFLQVTLDRVQLDGEFSILAVMNDATEFKTLEAQFVQSQKMQAVGQLAGGVAHDFNNLLTAINGHCDLILMRHETSDTDYGDLIQIRHNANRAASLVGQLLAFSRKQTLLPKVIDLYDTLSDLNHLLNRLLGEKVTLRIEHDDNLPNVRVDERQLEQVIMNLVVNARDAMPNGGEVVIRTKTANFEQDQKMDRVVIPFGTYVQIDVTDTGVGIPEDKISKIFEPFFTTKGVGEGTGLGLSTAYGIIKQTGGFIFANSEVGSGTTFTLYLPSHAEAPDLVGADEQKNEQPTDLTGRGIVLLVEDEVPVRSFAARALNIRGYTVIEAGSAEEALEILEDDDLEVDVFVSDVIMPGMDGPTWVKMAQQKRADVRVVFVSGYAEDVFEGGQISVPNATFLPKPFSLNELTHTVKEQMEKEAV